MAKVNYMQGNKANLPAVGSDANTLYFTNDTKEFFKSVGAGLPLIKLNDPAGIIDTDNTMAANSDSVVPSQKAVKEYITAHVGSVTGGLVYKGLYDASTGNFSSISNPTMGWFYKVSVAGQVSGLEMSVGDMLIINKDVTGTPTTVDIDKIDNTEAADILRNSILDTDVTLSANSNEKLPTQQAVKTYIDNSLSWGEF